MKREEFEINPKDLMCAFFVYGLRCPDEVEFGECQYQHDHSILQAHNMGRSQDKTDVERAEGVEKLLHEEG